MCQWVVRTVYPISGCDKVELCTRDPELIVKFQKYSSGVMMCEPCFINARNAGIKIYSYMYMCSENPAITYEDFVAEEGDSFPLGVSVYGLCGDKKEEIAKFREQSFANHFVKLLKSSSKALWRPWSPVGIGFPPVQMNSTVIVRLRNGHTRRGAAHMMIWSHGDPIRNPDLEIVAYIPESDLMPLLSE